MSAGPERSAIVAIEQVALELFAARGFDETPVEDIAEAAGISRRTFFRYFGSKSDILFSEFTFILEDLDAWLLQVDDERPMFEAIADAVMRFNRLQSDGPTAHRQRMELILHTPALRANSALRHGEWLAVVARFAARRMDEPIHGLGPQLAAQIALGAANVAYDQWLRDPDADLTDRVRATFSSLPDICAR